MAQIEVVEQLNGGKIIALEGDSDIISTQLRLLPPSQNILVLAPLQQSLFKSNGHTNFEPRAFIRDVYQVYTQRIKTAKSFLENAPHASSRLVFMNGGSLRARTLCIESICENITAGQIGAAEAMFTEILKDELNDGPSHNHNKRFSQDENIPDVLDRKRDMEASSTTTPDPPLTTESVRSTKISWPSMDHNLESSKDDDEKFLRSTLINSSKEGSTPTHRRWTFETPSYTATSRLDSLQSEIKDSKNLDEAGQIMNGESSVLLDPTSPTESLFVDSPVSMKQEPKDAFEVKRSKSAEFDRETRFLQRATKSPRSDSTLKKQPDAPKPPISKSLRISSADVSHAAFLKAYQTTIIGSPASCRSPVSSERFRSDDLGGKVKKNPQPDEPIFYVAEDFVIHFTGGMIDVIFDAVLRSYQHGKYPAHLSPLTVAPDSNIYPEFPPLRSDSVHQESSTCEGPELSQKSVESDAYKMYGSPRPTKPSKSATNTSSICPRKEEFLTFSPSNSRSAVDVQNCFRQLLSSHFSPKDGGFNQYHHPISVEIDRLWKPVFGKSGFFEDIAEKTCVDQIIAVGCDESSNLNLSMRLAGVVERLGIKSSGTIISSKLDIRYFIANLQQNPHILPSRKNGFDPPSEPSLFATLIIPQLEAYLAAHSSCRLLILQFTPSYIPVVFALRELIGSSLFKVAGVTSAIPSEQSRLTNPPLSPLSPNPLSNDAVASRNRTREHPAKGSSTSGTGILRVTLIKPITPPSDSKTFIPNLSLASSDFVLQTKATESDFSIVTTEILKILLAKSRIYEPEPEPEPKTIVQVVEKYFTAPTPTLSFTTTPSRPTSQQRPSAHDEYPMPEAFYNSKHHSRLSKISALTRNSSFSRSISEFRSRHNYAPSIASSRRTFVSKLSDDYDGWENFEICDDDSDFDDYDRMIMGRRMSAMVMGGRFLGAPYGEDAMKERGAASKRKALKWLGLA